MYSMREKILHYRSRCGISRAPWLTLRLGMGVEQPASFCPGPCSSSASAATTCSRTQRTSLGSTMWPRSTPASSPITRLPSRCHTNYMLLSLFHNVRLSNIIHIYLDVDESRYMYVFRFINIYMYVGDARKSYIM